MWCYSCVLLTALAIEFWMRCRRLILVELVVMCMGKIEDLRDLIYETTDNKSCSDRVKVEKVGGHPFRDYVDHIE